LNEKNPIIYYLFLSAVGASLISLVMILSLLSSPNTKTIHMSDKLAIGIPFIVSCLFGISIAIKPNLTGSSSKQGGHDGQCPQTIMIRHEGHHPECEQFMGHTIKMENKILCAGCSGLAMGSVISIALMSAYILFFKEIQQDILPFLVIFGMVLIALNYIEIVIPGRKAYFHMISNCFLVISFFFIITGIFHLTGSVIYGLFGILISFLWLDTRIQLSNWHHFKVCKNCRQTCKVFNA
jgi:hypothetical protein